MKKKNFFLFVFFGCLMLSLQFQIGNQLNISDTPSNAPNSADTEPNDNFAQAETISPGLISGTWNSTNVNDYYNITIQAGQRIIADISCNTSYMSYYIYNPSQNQVYSYTYSNPVNSSYAALMSGIYTLRFYDPYSTPSKSYTGIINLTYVPKINQPTTPEYDGKINVNWQYNGHFSTTYLFRDTTPITVIPSTTPIYEGGGTSFQDTVPSSATYYYAIVQGNATHNTTISNWVSISVNLQVPGAPTLTLNSPNPCIGNIDLSWSGQTETQSYSVYRDTQTITTTSGKTPITTTGGTTFTDSVQAPGTYYYIVIATNYQGNSLISNSFQVVVSKVVTKPYYTKLIDTYSWIDVSGGTLLNLDDDGSTSVAIPFTFNFYGKDFTTVNVASNGFINFNKAVTSTSGSTFPSTNENSHFVIAPMWDDLDPATGGGGGNIYTYSGSGFFAVGWIDIEHYSVTNPKQGSFEVLLFSNGKIKIQYDYVNYTSTYHAGINFGDGVLGHNMNELVAGTTDNYAVLFWPNDMPTISSPSDVSIETNSTGNILWSISDTSVNNSYVEIYLNGTLLSNTTRDVGTITQSINTTVSGIFNYTAIFYDGLGKSCRDEVIVTVLNYDPVLNSPSDQYVLQNTAGGVITWTVSDNYIPSGMYYIYRNGVEIYNGTCSNSKTIQIQIGALSGGTHTFLINVTDGAGGKSIDTVVVVAQANTAPQLFLPINATYIYNTTGNTIRVNISDYVNSGGWYELSYNGSQWFNGTWSANGNISVLVSIDGLPVGTYTLNITIHDGYGLWVNKTITIYVTSNSTNTGTTATVAEDGIDGFDFGYMIGISGMMILMVIVYTKKRRFHVKS
jgi:hypothetical protein